MLTEEYPFLSPLALHRDLAIEEKLRALAHDIGRIRSGDGPLAADLAGSPWINRWRPVMTAHGIRLMGQISGHPTLGSCHGMTTQLWAADPHGSWVRSFSRFYRLGPPIGIGNDGISEIDDV